MERGGRGVGVGNRAGEERGWGCLGINKGPSWRAGRLGWVGQAMEMGRGLVQTNGRGSGVREGREGLGAKLSMQSVGLEQSTGPSLEAITQGGLKKPWGLPRAGSTRPGACEEADHGRESSAEVSLRACTTQGPFGVPPARLGRVHRARSLVTKYDQSQLEIQSLVNCE